VIVAAIAVSAALVIWESSQRLSQPRLIDGVVAVGDLPVRWHGHQLRIAASVAVDPELTVKRGHDIAHDVEHALHHQFPAPIVATIHIEPHD
jgi:divalent metal cation (Fe/Co/Zn/Cd) transporter